MGSVIRTPHNCANMSSPVLFLFLLAFAYTNVHCDDSDGEYDGDYWENFSRNLNTRINNQVRNNLKGLDNLGATISQQVHNGLRPVREMQSRFRVVFGNDGTTIATFSDRQFIVRNGVMYDCSGTISESDGSCSGTLEKANFREKKDFCYANINSIINNWYCIGNGNVNSGYINGKTYCNSGDNSPTLLITADEYKTLCGSTGRSVTYKYFSNVPMGDHGPEMQCNDGKPVVCTMTQNRGNFVHSGTRGSYIQINN